MNTNTVARHKTQVQVASSQVVVKRKPKRGKRSALINQTDTMLCKAKPLTKRNDKSRLEPIACDLLQSKKMYEQYKHKYDMLREKAMKIMVPNSVCKTKYGKLKHNTLQTKKRFNRKMLCDELLQRDFSEADIKEIIEASLNQITFCEHVSFTPKKRRNKK